MQVFTGDIPLETVSSSIRKVELEWYRSERPMLFAAPPTVATDELTARGRPGDLLVRIVALPEQTRFTRLPIGQPATSSTHYTPGFLYRLASLSLDSSKETTRPGCPLAFEHTLGGSAVLRLKVSYRDGTTSTQTSTAQFGNCQCLCTGTEAVARVSEEMRRAGLQI